MNLYISAGFVYQGFFVVVSFVLSRIILRVREVIFLQSNISMTANVTAMTITALAKQLSWECRA